MGQHVICIGHFLHHSVSNRALLLQYAHKRFILTSEASIIHDPSRFWKFVNQRSGCRTMPSSMFYGGIRFDCVEDCVLWTAWLWMLQIAKKIIFPGGRVIEIILQCLKTCPRASWIHQWSQRNIGRTPFFPHPCCEYCNRSYKIVRNCYSYH